MKTQVIEFYFIRAKPISVTFFIEDDAALDEFREVIDTVIVPVIENKREGHFFCEDIHGREHIIGLAGLTRVVTYEL